MTTTTYTHDTGVSVLTIKGRNISQFAGPVRFADMSDKIQSMKGTRGDTIVSVIHDPRQDITVTLLPGDDSAFLSTLINRGPVSVSFTRQDGGDKVDIPLCWVKGKPDIMDDEQLEAKVFRLEGHQSGVTHGAQTVARVSA